MDLEAIGQRHDAVEALHRGAQLRSDLRTLHLRGGWAGRVAGGGRLGLVVDWLLGCSGSKARVAFALVFHLQWCLPAAKPSSLSLPPTPAGMPDLDRLCGKLEKQKVSLQELCQLYRASAKLPQLAEAVQAHEGAHAAQLVDRCGAAVAEAGMHCCRRAERISQLPVLLPLPAGQDLCIAYCLQVCGPLQ